MPELTLLRGAEGSLPITATSHYSLAQNFTLVLTLDHALPATLLLPPGVSISFQPASAVVPPNGTRTFLATIRAEGDAPVGAYQLYLSGYAAGAGVGTEAFWLVVGPYSPRQSFSLVDPADYLAKNATSDSLWVLESDPSPQSPGYYDSLQAQLAASITIRSEGPPLSVGLSITNSDVPSGVKVSLSQNEVGIAAGDQGGASIEVNAPFGTPLGVYSFDVLATQGAEEHLAHYSLTVLPLPPPDPYSPPNVVVNQTVSGYHLDLYVNYRWGWIDHGMNIGNNASFVYTVVPRDPSPATVTYASIQVDGPSGEKLVSLQMAPSSTPEEFILFLGNAGTYDVTVTAYARGTNGTVATIGSASGAFLVIDPNAQTGSAPTNSPILTVAIVALASASIVASALMFQRRRTARRRIVTSAVGVGLGFLGVLAWIWSVPYSDLTAETWGVTLAFVCLATLIIVITVSSIVLIDSYWVKLTSELHWLKLISIIGMILGPVAVLAWLLWASTPLCTSTEPIAPGVCPSIPSAAEVWGVLVALILVINLSLFVLAKSFHRLGRIRPETAT